MFFSSVLFCHLTIVRYETIQTIIPGTTVSTENIDPEIAPSFFIVFVHYTPYFLVGTAKKVFSLPGRIRPKTIKSMLYVRFVIDCSSHSLFYHLMSS